MAGLLCACTLAALLGIARASSRDRTASLLASSRAGSVLEVSFDRFPVASPPATGPTQRPAALLGLVLPEAPSGDPGPSFVLVPPSRAPPV